MGSFSKLKAILEEKKRFLVICHEHPDGDSIGALLALNEILKELGKECTLVSKDPVPSVFRFLPEASCIKQDFLIGNYDALMLVDNGDLRRTGFVDRLTLLHRKKLPIINIDHHPKNDIWKIATVNYAETEASSACEVIYYIATGLEISITPRLATALMTGIFTDTGGFQHPNTSQRVLDIASDLMKKGARLRAISSNISHSRSVAMLRLWGVALSRLSINPELGLAYSILTREDIEKVGACEDEVSGLVNLISAIPETRAALLLYETGDGRIKGSLRTESDKIDLSKLAALLGGGGHKRASGFSIDGRLELVNNVWQAV